ncbi:MULTISPECIES: hypothetical protein [Lysinibacillus]|uniref:Uncharacterized protein n=1 Tax=Lysinibacillus fusiformis TaxID=28031 RepID=A0A2I0UYX5_9BACI|nr:MULTISPECIES: hypothetical protein [Lysinibacillus]PKU51250.1 hypothetical protein CRI88_11000 [Lysinibacillus fusiformis]SCY07741.1 hypothetical protein SAMN02787078_00729 [Lysinibacillus sp. SG9]SDB13572.1 hypothetical protein SAMN02787079_01043 [Lysinibacillus sp. TC-37]SFS52046.1 hypothetical protein SAMN02787087_01046 [Lysinibacillus sp. SG55]
MKKIILILAWITTVVLMIINIKINPSSYFANGTIILGWLLFALQLSWNKSEWFYLTCKNLWYKFTNPECIWNMSIEYYGTFNEQVFEKLDQIFLNKESSKVLQVSNVRRIYKVGTLSFEVVIDRESIRIELSDLEVSYRRSTHIIKTELGNILEDIPSKLKNDRCEYYLDIYFKGENPYYGLYLRRLDIRDIETFKIQFNIQNEKIVVNKERISINTNSLQSLRNFSEEYLTISPR